MPLPAHVRVLDHALIHAAAVAAAGIGAGLARLPGADLPLLTGIQGALVISLAHRRGIPLTRAAAVDLVLQLLAGMTGRFAATHLAALLPAGAGEAVRAAVAAGLTEALGWAAVAFFDRDRAVSEAGGLGSGTP